MIKLSILICSLESRKDTLNELLDVLTKQKTDEVEILIDTDNGEKCIGEKRDDLLKKAKGEYVVSIDDDDLISNDYIKKIIEAIDKSHPDCIGIEGVRYWNGEDPSPFICSKMCPKWEDKEGVSYSPIHHVNPVKRELAQKVGFPHIDYNEDKIYSIELIPLLKTEEYIEGPIYIYRYSPEKSEAIKRDKKNKSLGLKVYHEYNKKLVDEAIKKRLTVTATMSTKGRYFTTLPNAIIALTQQTVTPDYFILFDDGEHKDIREIPIYKYILNLLYRKGIEWEVIFGNGTGQVRNHQIALEKAKTHTIWRIDDDEIPEPNVLETLLSNMKDDIGAVAGVVLDPTNVGYLPEEVTGKIEKIFDEPNMQWFKHKDNNIKEVEHLYSTFLFRKEVALKAGGYCMELSPAGHREETIFSHSIFRQGYKLLIDPRCITWHFRNPEGGIRTYSSPEYWKHDEDVFLKKMNEWKTPFQNLLEGKFFAFLDNGLGDHLMFKSLLPEIREKNKGKEIVIAVCYPDIFRNEKNITLLGLNEGKAMCAKSGKSIEDFNLYKFCEGHQWKKHMIEAFREIYNLK